MSYASSAPSASTTPASTEQRRRVCVDDADGDSATAAGLALILPSVRMVDLNIQAQIWLYKVH